MMGKKFVCPNCKFRFIAGEDLDDDDDDDKDEPEPKKPSWISRKASSAKDWLKGHFTRPVEEENPQDYVWGGQGKFDNF
jgi:hypothetical protein